VTVGITYCIFLDLQLGLKKFVSDETTRAFDQLAEEDIKSFKDGTLNVDDVVKFWDTAFRSEHVEYAEQAGQSDEELFSVVYHKLVHSPALETILQAEQVFAETARTAAKRRTGKIATLSERYATYILHYYFLCYAVVCVLLLSEFC